MHSVPEDMLASLDTEYPYTEALAHRDAENGYPETYAGEHKDFV